jgi:type II secretory pathway component GspD/PulD (secretin)
MKKTCYPLLIALTSLVMVQAQDNNLPAAQPAVTATSAPAEITNAPAAEVSDNTTNASADVTNAAAVTDSAAHATAPAVAANSAATNTMETSAATTAETSDTNATEAAESGTTTAPIAVSIPRIQFNDVPIRTAIENLARLANINYMLDPKIGYGQPDANGQIKPEPTLSIRWENITAENALLALLDNYGLQLIRDKNTGIARITLKDPTAPPPLFTKVIQLKYAGVSNIVESVKSVLTDKRSKVLADIRTSQLVVVATDPEQQAVDTLITQLDKPTRQVLIETRLVEISTNPKTKKGVDWTGTLQNQNVTFGNGNSLGTFTTTFPGKGATDPAGVATTTDSSTIGTIENAVGGGGFSWNTKSGTTPDIGFLNADGLSAVLSFLNSSADAQVMSTPRVVTLDNEEAKISVTRGYPVFSVTAGTANTSGGSQVSYTNVGTILHVTPRISANDYIWLRVLPEVSSFFGNFNQTIAGQTFSAPIFDTRIVETSVLVPNSNTLVIGGLVQDNPRAGYTKVPLLGDIPGLGLLFRSEDKEVNKDNLLIFITPTIVQDSDFQSANNGAKFLKTKPITMKDPMDPTTAWDSPAPKGVWEDPIKDSVK